MEKKLYPFTALECMFPYETKFHEDAVIALEYALSKLPFESRDVTIFHQRFMQNMTFTDIGEAHNLSGSRARDIVLRMLRLIRASKYADMILLGINAWMDREATNAASIGFKLGYNDGYECGSSNQENGDMPPSLFKETPISALGLSSRAKNCMYRLGYTTVEEVAALTYDDLMKVRGLGKLSYEEIIEKLDAMGYDVSNMVKPY